MNDNKQSPIHAQEEKIFALVKQGQKDQAKKMLFDLVVDLAKQHDFRNAERLRDRIYEIDAMALTEIIRSGEIIEEEKSKSIDQNLLEIWANLTKSLTTEEYSAIYHEMEHKKYKADQQIVRQGDKTDALFFINTGTVIVSHVLDQEELFINELVAGEIIGENFFEPSFWTVTLTAQKDCDISTLIQKNLKRHTDEFPGLESKLKNFYARFHDIQALLTQKELDRRTAKRYQVNGKKIIFQIIAGSGKPSGKGFRADLSDISEGGLAFLVRISKKENCRQLLGRNVRVSIPLKIKGSEQQIHKDGRIVSVQPFNMLESDYAVHLQFNSPFPPAHVAKIVNLKPAQPPGGEAPVKK